MKQYFYQLATDKKNDFCASVCKFILWLFSMVYSLILRLRNILYDEGLLRQTTLEVPVISIGNVTWGGVGKTPLVEMIAAYLKEKKKCPLLQEALLGQAQGVQRDPEY